MQAASARSNRLRDGGAAIEAPGGELTGGKSQESLCDAIFF